MNLNQPSMTREQQLQSGRFANNRLSDLMGCCFFAGLAVWTLVSVPALSVWLLPTLAHELFVAIAFLIRDRARAAAPSLAARMTSYGGTLLIIGFVHVARLWKPEWLSRTRSLEAVAAGTILWLAGSIVVVVSIWWLRHAFSIEPEARRMVTTGPYRFARHPIYSGYVLQCVGFWLNYPTPTFGCVIAVWLWLTLARIRFEERVLLDTFPEYAAYRQTVGAVGPRLLRLSGPAV